MIINIKKSKKQCVYIGRPSEYGNPFRPSSRSVEAHTVVCAKYKKYLWHKLCSHPGFVLQVRALEGQTLGCFCKPLPCHGDVLEVAIAWLCSDDGYAMFNEHGERI